MGLVTRENVILAELETEEPSDSKPEQSVTGWVASVDWYGPFRCIEDCAAAAEDAHKDDPSNFHDFGLYMATGKLKSWSLMPPKVLYIGQNRNNSEDKLWKRIRKSPSLQFPKDYGGKAHFWFGIMFGPVFDGDFNHLAGNTERALIYSLNPVLNKNAFSQPEFRFGVQNGEPKFLEKAIRDPRLKRHFKALVPSYIECRPDRPKKELHYIWRLPSGDMTKKTEVRAPKNGFQSKQDRLAKFPFSLLGIKWKWQIVWSERLFNAVHRIDRLSTRSGNVPYAFGAVALLLTGALLQAFVLPPV